MKPFDLESAKKGAKVCTRDGCEARILCFDSGGVGYNEVPMPIIAEVFLERGSSAFSYRETGRIDGTRETCYDLMMADDDYLEKLERGEYDHIGEATEKVGHILPYRDVTPSVELITPFDESYWRRMYAGMAMQGLCAAHGTTKSAEHIARGAVECADALIEELKKEKK